MGIFDELKTIGDVLRRADKIEQYKQILEIQEKLLEMQKRIADLESENKNLKEKLEIKENLIYENYAYWIKKGEGKNGPFCSRCWDKNKDLIRLHPCGNPSWGECPECKFRFELTKNKGHTDIWAGCERMTTSNNQNW